MPILCLTIHADYRCRHSGVCCSSGWPIPVERDVEIRLRRAIEDGRLRPAAADPPNECFAAWASAGESRSLLRQDSAGRCHFLGSDRLCTIHSQLGPSALPSTCRQFPRLAVLTPPAIRLSLSHYCPTAAASLFRSDLRLAVTDCPPAFPPGDDAAFEGLDARSALPPFLRPGVMMCWESHDRWERFCVDVFSRSDLTAAQAVWLIRQASERLRSWRPSDGPLDRCVANVAESTRATAAVEAPRVSMETGIETWRRVASCALRHWTLPLASLELLQGPDPGSLERGWPETSGLAEFEIPVRGYLGAKAFASWIAFLGEGLRTTASLLSTALAVLHVEAARVCAREGRALSRGLLVEAIQRSDLLLVHLTDPQALARWLGRSELGAG